MKPKTTLGRNPVTVPQRTRDQRRKTVVRSGISHLHHKLSLRDKMGAKRKEKSSKKPASEKADAPAETKTEAGKKQLVFDLTVPTFEKDLLEQEKERVSKLTEKKSKEEYSIDRKKREILLKARELSKIPPPPKYEPQEPVTKSAKLKEYEKNIRKGKFFDEDYKKFLYRELPERFNWLEPYDYASTFDTVGISRHRIWKSVY